jgi:hypothetical protein
VKKKFHSTKKRKEKSIIRFQAEIIRSLNMLRPNKPEMQISLIPIRANGYPFDSVLTLAVEESKLNQESRDPPQQQEFGPARPRGKRWPQPLAFPVNSLSEASVRALKTRKLLMRRMIACTSRQWPTICSVCSTSPQKFDAGVMRL